MPSLISGIRVQEEIVPWTLIRGPLHSTRGYKFTFIAIDFIVKDT